jgi:lysophospholipase L1-like esterase
VYKRQTLDAYRPTDSIVFLGDSITYSYNLKHHFTDENIINSGIWGDRTDQAFSRLDTDVIAYNPKKIFILLGINDVGYGRTNKDITKRMSAIIKKLQKDCPSSKIYLLSVCPLNISDFEVWYLPMSEGINDKVDELNLLYIELANKFNINYIDISSSLKNENNELIKEYSVEGLHLTEAAYEIASEVLKDYLD